MEKKKFTAYAHLNKNLSKITVYLSDSSLILRKESKLFYSYRDAQDEEKLAGFYFDVPKEAIAFLENINVRVIDFLNYMSKTEYKEIFQNLLEELKVVEKKNNLKFLNLIIEK